VAILTVSVLAALLVAFLDWLVGYTWHSTAFVSGLAAFVALACGAWIWLSKPVLADIIGDAARYLDNRPENIGARRAIREAGLALLRGLHDEREQRYQRVVVVGHSLGSVIAYDLLTWFWQERHALVKLTPDHAELIPTVYDRNAPAPRPADSAEAVAGPMTPEAWQERQFDNGSSTSPRATVADRFDHLGQSLTYAESLVTRDLNELGLAG
jgi:hypothetical protein